jgi:MbtH protein
MAGPFDAEDSSCPVLVDDEGQRSLRPADIDLPAGRDRVLGPAGRRTCLDPVERRWMDPPARSSRAVPVRRAD